MTKYRIADLFCGAGGTSSGAFEAARALGRVPELTAVNHWDVAIATHTVNHPGSRHFCTGIDDINPRKLFGEGELDLLWASPECTHHSIARGGKPINDQSRATAWCVIRWAEALRPPIILIENVPEFLTWGPIGTNGRPLKKRKGEIFKSWVKNLESIGYKVDWRLLCAADYGDPTTRTRLFVQAVRGKRRIVWPEKTHSKEADLLTARRWAPARDIIDWSLPAGSIFERKKPLSEKTLARIEAGLRKFGLKGFILPQQTNPTPKGLDEPVPTVVAEGSGPKLVQPFIVPQFGEREGQEPRTHSLDAPLPAVTSHGAGALVEPFLVTVANGGEDQYRSASIDGPLSTVTAGGVRHALAQPFIVAWDQQSSGPGGGVGSIDEPISTVVTKARHGVADPFLVKLRGGTDAHIESSARSLDAPCGTVTAAGSHHALVEPFLVKTANGESRAGEHTRARNLSDPLPTVCTSGDMALVEPFLVNMKGQSDAADIDLPSPTVTAHAPHLYLTEPFLIKTANGANGSEASRSKSLDEPAPTVCGNRGDLALIEPFIMSAGGPECPARGVSLPVGTILTRDHRAIVEPVLEPCLLGQQSGAALRPLSQPAPTISTAGAVALVEPFLVGFYGTGHPHDINQPAPTVTTKDRFGLVRPVIEIDGARYLLDVRFRMLQPHELALAQGFPKGYTFTGTKTDQVKQIGNAVPRRLARALVAAVLSQNSDVSALVTAEEREVAA